MVERGAPTHLVHGNLYIDDMFHPKQPNGIPLKNPSTHLRQMAIKSLPGHDNTLGIWCA
jgi:hypothetical protein